MSITPVELSMLDHVEQDEADRRLAQDYPSLHLDALPQLNPLVSMLEEQFDAPAAPVAPDPERSRTAELVSERLARLEVERGSQADQEQAARQAQIEADGDEAGWFRHGR